MVRELSATADRPGPVRMCVGCRRRDDPEALVRFVADRGARPVGLVIDVARTMPGRGAWLHPRAECLDSALRRKAFPVALRVPGLTVHPDDLTELIGEVTPSDGPATGQDR